MDKIREIYNEIMVMDAPQERQYTLVKIETDGVEVFYGKDSDDNPVFSVISHNAQLRPTIQKTKKLIFWFNAICSIKGDDANAEEIMNVLTCLSHNENEIVAFIRLSLAFISDASEQSVKSLSELFTSLTNLFANAHKASTVELQGFFGELYAIKYFNDLGINLGDYWQKKEKMKFDFSISFQKKIEVKTTTNELRIHHFRHEQLLSDLYDIFVISILLRDDDSGLSLLELIKDVQIIAKTNFNTLMYIEDFVKNFDESELSSIRFDTGYVDRNLHIFKAQDVPRFKEEQPLGVSKTEYDSDLTNSRHISNEEFIAWLLNV
ncbi:MAG: PD-(D/E)XK motif protein [Oscillospiraceae bacterium]|jgi:hypothetical protein|nr:PD-(D/E)XK motif protein [Oscillospiraceae bacterium]